MLRLNPQIFLDAADTISSHHWVLLCCPSIQRAAYEAGLGLGYEYRQYFASLFCPSNPEDLWWEPCEREARVVALCLAAAILEDEQS